MVYYKLILNDKRPTETSIYPVVIRLTYKRSNTTLSTGIRVKKDQWDAISQQVNKSHPNFQLLNHTISEFYLKVQKVVHQLLESNEFSFEDLKARLLQNSPTKVRSEILFKEFAEKLIQDMLLTNQTGNAIIYQTSCNRLLKFIDDPKLKFNQIDYTLLEGFRRKLIADGVKINTISNYFRTIRAIYNKAIKAKAVDRSLYPFYDISIKTEKTIKRAISIKEIQTLVKLEFDQSSQLWLAYNYFLLSFCLIGTSFTDLAYLKEKSIEKGRLICLLLKLIVLKTNPIDLLF